MTRLRFISMFLMTAVLAGAGGCASGSSETAALDVPTLLPTAGCGIEVTHWRIADGGSDHLVFDRPLEFVNEDELISVAREADHAEGESDEEPAAARPAVRFALPTAPVVDLPAIFRQYAEPREEDAALFAAMRRNGLEVIRIARENLPALRADLGVARSGVRNWHGQACDWRNLATRPLGEQVRAVVVGGRGQRFVGGDFQLQFRGWLMPMEDGPALQFELRGVYQAPPPRGLAARLKGREIRALSGARIELMLESEYVYVIAGARPGEQWPGSGSEQVERAGAIGPEAVMPLTFGRFMLDQSGTPPGREILLLDPRIPSELMPEPLAVAQAGADS